MKKGADLGETMSKVKEVFGGATSSVVAMADQMAEKFGSVKSVTLDAASNLGLVAQGAGLSAQQAAALSIRLTRLADDASSFFNVPLDVALEKIRSGLVGEAEPLRQFGVLLSEAAVKEQALAMGIKPAHGELSEQEKVLARVEIITRGLAKAQGDHERTMGSYTNKIRELTGAWENFEAAMGGPLANAAAAGISGGQASLGKSLDRPEAGGSLLDTALMLFSPQRQAEMATNFVLGAVKGFEGRVNTGAGVASGLPPAGPGKMDPLAAWGVAQIEYARRDREQRFEAGKFGGGGFGAFGMMGNLGGMVGNMAERGRLTEEINAKRKQMNAWGGSHITGAEDFMRSAQEKILQPQDETAKKQLDELIKCRDALQVIAGKQEGKAKVGGVVLKGRES